jgi:hypothetical protein
MHCVGAFLASVARASVRHLASSSDEQRFGGSGAFCARVTTKNLTAPPKPVARRASARAAATRARQRSRGCDAPARRSLLRRAALRAPCA